jgi:hypothetical protein
MSFEYVIFRKGTTEYVLSSYSMKNTFKKKIVLTRIDKHQEKKLLAYCEKMNQTKSKIIRNLINNLP